VPSSRSKKRKLFREALKTPKHKRLKGYYCNEYRQLLNFDILHASSRVIEDGGLPIPPSQIGVSKWASAEKESYFNALSRLGKDDTRGIASRIGSKSEPEVKAY